MKTRISTWSRPKLQYPRIASRLTQKRDPGRPSSVAVPTDHEFEQNSFRFKTLSLAFRAALQNEPAEAPSATWAPRLALTIQNHDHIHVDSRTLRHAHSNVVSNSYVTGRWKPISRVHRRGTAEVGDQVTSALVRRSRPVETWDISRVDRVYRSPRVETTNSAVVARGRSTPTKPNPTSPIDMNKLDNELWARFEKRIRIDRERRGRG